MQKMTALIIIFTSLLLLTGCQEKLSDIKVAISGIDTAANKAANAISTDAHSIRAIEINYNSEVFTINELFKSILRDVQWDYEELHNLHIFKVKGTWQDSLFANYHFPDDIKKQLAENGSVTIQFELTEQDIIKDSTSVKLTLNGETLVEESGKDALHYLFDYYLSK